MSAAFVELCGVLSMSGIAMSPRALLAAFAASMVAAASFSCGGDRGRNSPPADAARHARAAAPHEGADGRSRRNPTDCPVTPPNHSIPPGQGNNPGASRAPYHGNGALWTVLAPDGVIRKAPKSDGSIVEKFPWWRAVGVRGHLRITGRRLDAAGPPLRAIIPRGYGLTGFQASGISFPTAGCWTVAGTAGAADLSFVVLAAEATGN